MVMYSDQAFNNSSHAMESIHNNACLAITGAIRGTSKEKIYQELGLGSLQLCRCYGKLFLFYKVFKNEHPKCLFNVILVRSTSYATRTVSNIPLYKTKQNFFKNYFFLHLLLLNEKIETPVLQTLRVFQSLRKKYLISYDLPQVLFLIVTILKKLNALQDLDSVRSI